MRLYLSFCSTHLISCFHASSGNQIFFSRKSMTLMILKSCLCVLSLRLKTNLPESQLRGLSKRSALISPCKNLAQSLSIQNLRLSLLKSTYWSYSWKTFQNRRLCYLSVRSTSIWRPISFEYVVITSLQTMGMELFILAVLVSNRLCKLKSSCRVKPLNSHHHTYLQHVLSRSNPDLSERQQLRVEQFLIRF